MALNSNDDEVERLAQESRTGAVQRASRLRLNRGSLPRDQRIDLVLARFRQEFLRGDFGRRLTKAEEKEILGFGPHGV